jgi:hypothetical protein
MANAMSEGYPWYGPVSGPDIQQGDILLGCPIFEIPPEAATAQASAHVVKVTRQDVIVLTQSCDLVIRSNGECGVDEVILCPILFKSDLREDPEFGRRNAWNDAKRGKMPAYHVLNRCDLEGCSLDYMLVELSRVYSLSVRLVRDFAAGQTPRGRLLPPYREHLAQAFARFFMRVGLPVDIPDFT